MKPWRRWLWPLGKAILATAVLFFVGRQFYRDLEQISWDSLQVQPLWLVLSGALYLCFLAFSGGFWYRLLRLFEQKPTWGKTLRAYYLGHLGKYVPGKAWALLLRGSLVRSDQVRFSVAVVTAFYEVLTTMAAGALLAAVIFILQPPAITGLRWNPVFTGLLLLVGLAVPLCPPVFNYLVGRLAARFDKLDAFSRPRMQAKTLTGGLALTGIGWLFLSTSVWALLVAVLPNPPDWTLERGCHYLATIGLAYVAGFLAVFMPSGLAVREYFLLNLLGSEGPVEYVALAVLLLRLVWTTAEVIIAALLAPWQGKETTGIELSMHSGNK